MFQSLCATLAGTSALESVVCLEHQRATGAPRSDQQPRTRQSAFDSAL